MYFSHALSKLTWQPDGSVNEDLELLSVLVVVQPHLLGNRKCSECECEIILHTTNNLDPAAVTLRRGRVLPLPQPHGFHGDKQVLHWTVRRTGLLLITKFKFGDA